MTQRTQDVPAAFEREERYIVFKKSRLTQEQLRRLQQLILAQDVPPARNWQKPLPTVECVVVEHDWPEYEAVWAMIEARVREERARGGQQ